MLASTVQFSNNNQTPHTPPPPTPAAGTTTPTTPEQFDDRMGLDPKQHTPHNRVCSFRTQQDAAPHQPDSPSPSTPTPTPRQGQAVPGRNRHHQRRTSQRLRP